MVLVLSQVPTNLLVRAEEGEETKYKLSFELERDASALNEIYQKHDEAESESEKTDESVSDKEANGEANANQDEKSKANQVNDNDTVVDLSQETEVEENSSEEAKPIEETNDESQSSEEENEEAIVLPSGGGEGSAEEKAEEVKDLNITYTLHIKGEAEETIEKIVTYSVEKADFLGDLKFEGIETLSNNLEVKYYTKDDGLSFDEESENFDLYLETNAEKTVLELPSIGGKEDSLRVKESNFDEIKDKNETIEISEEHKVEQVLGNEEWEDNYELNIDASRSEYDDLTPLYYNLWNSVEKLNVLFDKDSNIMKSFNIEYELHFANGDDSVTKTMEYYGEGFYWRNTSITFEKIYVPYNTVEIEYYTPEGKEGYEPYIFHYDLYLEKSDEKMVLKVPKLFDPYFDMNPIININYDAKENTMPSQLYLDGTSGSDENDGLSKETPLKTFDKAKKLALRHKRIEEIIVIGTVEIEGKISLDDTNAIIKRDRYFGDYLLKVSEDKEVTLENITIDGHPQGSRNTVKSLIKVDKGATLNIKDGTVLENNTLTTDEGSLKEGGAVSAYGATINMLGGLIKDNTASYGGGIYLSNSTMNFSGGEIKDNTADNYFNGNDYLAAGGGILAENRSIINMSGDAIVSGNYSAEVGGVLV